MAKVNEILNLTKSIKLSNNYAINLYLEIHCFYKDRYLLISQQNRKI